MAASITPKMAESLRNLESCEPMLRDKVTAQTNGVDLRGVPGLVRRGLVSSAQDAHYTWYLRLTDAGHDYLRGGER